MNMQRTAIFAAVLFGLLLYIMYIEVPREQMETKKDFIFKGTSRSEFKDITVSSKSGSYTLHNLDPKKTEDNGVDELDGEGNSLKEDDTVKNWRLSDLPEAKLDTGRVNAILSSLVQLKADATINPKELESDLGIYGLASPEATLEVSYGDSKEKILLGKTNEYVSKRYVKLESKPELYMVSTGLFEAIDKKKNDLRDATPVEIKDGDIESITVKTKDKEIILEKKDIDTWNISSPISATGSVEAVNTLIRNLRNLKAEDFADNKSPAEYGFDAPNITVVIKGKEKEMDISLVKRKDGTWLKIANDKVLYKASGDPLTGIVSSVDNYREKKLFAFDSESALGLTIEKEGSKISVSKDEKGWKVNGKEGDQVFILQYLRDIADIQALSFVAATGAVDEAKAFLSVSVALKEGDKTQTKIIKVVSKNKDGYLAILDGGKDRFIISEDSFKKLAAKEESLVKVL